MMYNIKIIMMWAILYVVIGIVIFMGLGFLKHLIFGGGK